MMIPADAPHVANAHKWIDYIMRADVQAAITNKVKFTSPNAAARKLILPDLLANPIAFPPDDYWQPRRSSMKCDSRRRGA